MPSRPRTTSALVTLLVALAACGARVDAYVEDGSVTVTALRAEPVVSSGGVAFETHARMKAAADGARVRVDCGGSLSDAAVVDAPGPGIVEFDLAAGGELRRRDDTAFDIYEGTTRVRTGAVRGRLLIMYGRCYVSAEPEGNAGGIDLRLVARGNQLRAEVVRGTVLLNATDEEERNTIFVTLHDGETAVAKPGEEPRKGTTEWFQ